MELKLIDPEVCYKGETIAILTGEKSDIATLINHCRTILPLSCQYSIDYIFNDNDEAEVRVKSCDKNKVLQYFDNNPGIFEKFYCERKNYVK